MTSDFVFNQTLSLALKLGSDDRHANNAAHAAKRKYEKGAFKRAVDLIETQAKDAVKLTKIKGKKK